MRKSQDHVRPDFLIIGAPKAATTSLAATLDEHDEIAMSVPKEPFFFSRRSRWEMGWDWYASCFRHANVEALKGDASTDYSMTGTYPWCIDRIGKYLPDVKIIYVVRDPLPRLESFYLEKARHKETSRSFNMALKKEPWFLDSALYWRHICAYKNYFREDKICIIFFEELIANTERVLQHVYEFLGVSLNSGPKELKHLNGSIRTNSDERAARTSIRKALSVAPGLKRLAEALPPEVYKGLQSVGKVPEKWRPTWKPSVRSWILEQIRPDALELLNHYGKDACMWTLE